MDFKVIIINQTGIYTRIKKEINEKETNPSTCKHFAYDKCGTPSHWITQVEENIYNIYEKRLICLLFYKSTWEKVSPIDK